MEWLFLGALAIALAVFRASVRNRAAARSLATRAGFTPLDPFSSETQDWFVSVVHGRQVALGQLSLRLPFPGPFRKHALHLRLVMSVALPVPAALLALRSPHDTSSLHRFEEAFRVEHGELLGARAREELLRFVQLGYPASLGWRKHPPGPNARNLRLSRRDALPPHTLPEHLFPNARLLLIHDHPRLHLSADQFARLLNELTAVADAVEDDCRDSMPTQPVLPPARQ